MHNQVGGFFACERFKSSLIVTGGCLSHKKFRYTYKDMINSEINIAHKYNIQRDPSVRILEYGQKYGNIYFF